MARMKDLAIMLAEDYQKKHPEVSWEEAMEYVCGEGSDAVKKGEKLWHQQRNVIDAEIFMNRITRQTIVKILME